MRVVLATDQSLNCINGIRRVCDGLALRDLSDQALTFVRESDHAGGGAPAFFIGDDLDRAAFEHGDAAVGSPQIDSDDLTHGFFGTKV